MVNRIEVSKETIEDKELFFIDEVSGNDRKGITSRATLGEANAEALRLAKKYNLYFAGVKW